MPNTPNDERPPGGEPGSDEPPPDSTARSSMDDFVSRMRSFLNNPAPDESPPDGTIGRFEIVRELGRGAFGVVLLVFDPHLRCHRAMKIPTEAALNHEPVRRLFLREAQFNAAIDHPNVVRVVEADDLGGLCYLVLEYCPEGSLSAWMRARPKGKLVPEKWAALLVAQIADGVHQAHLKFITHRDLKPGNVLLVRVGPDVGSDTPDFCPKVADFGLAKLLESDGDGDRISVIGSPIGTYPYMSPEQARGRLQEIGPRSDVYSLGAILFELLADRRAYPQESPEELLKAILSDDPPPSLSEARPGVSRDLETICRTCMEKDPGDRYDSAAKLADDLRLFYRGEAIPKSPLSKRLRSFAKKNPWLRAAAAALLIAAVLVGAGKVYTDAIRRGEAAAWIKQVRAADLSTLAELRAKHDPSDPLVRADLEAMFGEDHAGRKLSAAVMLATSEDPRYADHAYDRMLGAEPHEISPLVRALNGRIAKLEDRLKATATAITKAGDETEAEQLDRRRANAATALVLIGQTGPGLDVLTFTPQPQARSFLIHTLGPAGTPPGVLFDALKATDDDSTRRSLLQALGEVSDADWARNKEVKAAIIVEAKRLYVEDPDAGVHGSAKWLLRRWGLKDDIKVIDEPLRERPRRPGFGWRITKTGLTMVIVRAPELDGTVIEVSDCEISASDYLRYFSNHIYDKGLSPDSDDSPINSLDYNRSAAFCNELTADERAGSLAYEPVRNGPVAFFLLVENPAESLGYRLPTDREFEILCRAGVRSVRYYGHAQSLMKHYAIVTATLPRLMRGSLKPNDLGLFDTLGNVAEWSRSTDPKVDRFNQAVHCGSSFHVNPLLLACGQHSTLSYLSRKDLTTVYSGFRVVRTLKVRDEDLRLTHPGS